MLWLDAAVGTACPQMGVYTGEVRDFASAKPLWDLFSSYEIDCAFIELLSGLISVTYARVLQGTKNIHGQRSPQPLWFFSRGLHHRLGKGPSLGSWNLHPTAERSSADLKSQAISPQKARIKGVGATAQHFGYSIPLPKNSLIKGEERFFSGSYSWDFYLKNAPSLLAIERLKIKN
jgi:hypothetical protein